MTTRWLLPALVAMLFDGARTEVGDRSLNHDLAPRDEYFLNNGEVDRAFSCDGQGSSAPQ